MPRIERYTRGIIKPRAVADTVNTRAISDAVAPYAAAAEASGFAAEKLDKIALAREEAAVNEAVIKNERQKLEYITRARQENMASPEDFADRLDPELKKIDEQFMQTLPTGRAKSFFQNDVQGLNNQIYKNNFEWTISRNVAIAAEKSASAELELGNASFALAQQDAPIEQKLEALKRLRDKGEVTVSVASNVFGNKPEKIAEMRRGTMKTIERNYAMGLMESDPQAAIDYLNDVEQSGSIPAGDRVNLINTAQNVIRANKNEANRQQTKSVAQDTLAVSDIKNRVYSGVEKPAALITEIKQMEASGKIDASTANELTEIASGERLAKDPKKVSFEEKDALFTKITVRAGNFLDQEFTITQDKIKEFSELESDLIKGISSGVFPSVTPAKKMLEEIRKAMRSSIENDNVEKDSWGDFFSGGVEHPISKGLSIIKKDIPSVTGQQMVLAKYADLISDYQSTGNTAKDEKIIRDNLEEAKRLYNEEVNRPAADAGANDVVPMTLDQINAEIRELEKELGIGN